MTTEPTRRPEPRSCKQCGYKVVNPYVKRCPRCLADLGLAAVACGSCAHGCAAAMGCAPAQAK